MGAKEAREFAEALSPQVLQKGRLRRELSIKDMDEMASRGTGRTGRRSFVRFWAMVEPKVWHA